MNKSSIIIINKDKNMTSRDVVNSLVSFFNTKKIGHTGTLDPIATGVLVCCLNEATKLVDLLTATDKEYTATMKLGIKTDTYDITGKIIDQHEVNITKDQVEDSLKYFNKSYEQEVPIYSSVKVNGKKLYEYARNGQFIKLPKRLVTIKEIKLISYIDDLVTFKCLVTKGTYIRSLIDDLGNYLGCYATMTELTRTKQGKFNIEQSFTLEDIKEGRYKTLNIEEVLDFKKEVVTGEKLKQIKNGCIINKTIDDQYIMFYEEDKLIAIYQNYDKDVSKIKPYIMFMV